MIKEYDVIVVGSGVAGCAVAYEMSRRGRSVLLLERGGRTEIMGNSLTVALILENFGLTRSKEKCPVTFADNYGGLSNLAAGCAIQVPGSVFGPLGIDLSVEAEAARKEMWVHQLPDDLIGAANLRLLQAAHDAGYNWKKLENFIDPEKCTPDCSNCMLGCKRGAKFTGRVYGDEAVKKGAELMLRTKVTRLLVDEGKAIGVETVRWGKVEQHHGKSVVLSAGVGGAQIARNAGIEEAGRGFCCDFLQFVAAEIPGMNTRHANPMTVGTLEHYESDGLVIVPVFPNWSQFALLLWYMGAPSLAKIRQFWNYSGIMVKVRDEIAGKIYEARSFSKPITRADRQKLDKGVEIIKRIFSRAGARSDSVFATLPLGAHPSATCRIGEVVDIHLETRIQNLFCCDASVFPSSLGLPTMWTVVSLAKRLAAHLNKRLGN